MSEPAAPRWSGDPSIPGPLDRDVALALLQRAQALAEQGDYQQAAQTYARVVGHNDPTIHTAALLGLAESSYRLDDEPRAIQAWITAAQAPENPLSWSAWKSLAQARVREGDLPGALRAYREAERRAPQQERPEIASRLGWLNKEMGERGRADRYFARSRTGLAPTPIATYVLMAITIAIGISILFLGQANFWYDLLALDKRAVEHGEYWRLLTVVFVHDNSSFLHLAFNMYALWIVGPVVEALYGSTRFVFVYFAAAAAGSTASYVFSAAPISVGASGAIFGLFGALLVANLVHKPALTRQARSLTSQIGILIVINLVFGFAIPNIDNAAHIGGLLAGGWLGFVLPPRGATARSYWTPSPGPGAPLGSAPTAGIQPPRPDAFDATRLLQLLAVIALLGVIGLGVWIGPLGHLARG